MVQVDGVLATCPLLGDHRSLALTLVTPSGRRYKFFELACSQLQNKQTKLRGHLRDLIEHPYFSHPVVGILEFLSAITLKTTSEKEQFFR
jgi:hypothetical protein